MGLQVLDSTIPGPPGPKGDQGNVGPGVINWRGSYDNATAYALNDAVTYQGSSYICIALTTGNLPTNTSFWNLLAQKGDTGATGATGAAGAEGLDITWRGAYDNATAYVVNDAVSYQGSSYICKSATTGNVPTNPTYWDLLASKGDQGNLGIQGVQGVQGAHGGAITIRYTISDQTDNTDPGNGNLRLNNFSDQNAATVIRVDHLDADGTDWSSALPTFDDSTSTIKGHIRLVNPADQSKWLLFTVSSVGSESGYKNITVVNVGSGGTNPFTNGQTVLLTFTRHGDKGDTGATGSAGADGLDINWRGEYDNGTVYAINDAVSYQGSSYIAIAATTGNLPTNASFWNLMAQKGDAGAQGPDGNDGVVGAHGGAISIEYTFDDTTTDSDPGSGLLRLSNSTQNASTVIRADHLDIRGTDWTSVLTSLDDSTSANKGQIRLFKADDQSKWLVFNVTSVGSETGYKNITVANVASSAPSPFANGNPIVLSFTRTGDKGQTGDTGSQGAQGDPGEDGLDITWRSEYDNGTMYVVNDAVSYQGSSYICTATTTGNLPTNAAFWDLMAQKGDTGAAGSNGTNGTDGVHGGAVTIEYTFSTTTTNSDPGNGFLRLNQATQITSNTIRADLLDRFGGDWTTILDSLDDSTSTVKGYIRLVAADDPTKWILFSVSLVSPPVGYRNINVSHIDSSASSPFADNDIVLLTFTRTGDKGDTGNTGSTGATGAHGGAITVRYTFSTTTTDSDPGNGNLRLNQATQNTATVIRADLVDANGTTWTSVLDSLDDSTSSVRGHIRLVHETDNSKWLLFIVSAVGSETGYRNITVTNVASSESSPFSNSDPILLTFSRTGDQGAPGLTGNPGQDGQDGRHGGAITVEYTFSTTTTDSDPGNGVLRLNQATQNTATVIRADLVDANGTTWTTVLDSLDDSTSTIKGLIRLVHATDPSKWIVFTLSAIASPAGYRNLTVAVVSASSANPFTNGDSVVFAFTRNGDKGDAGESDAVSVIDVFLASGTWNKRTGATRVTGILVAGGGGGGSGRKGANSTDRNGGTGGAGGGARLFDLSAASVGSTETITVGTGGTGGAAQTVNSTNGNNGSAGGTTSFGAHASATGGAGGAGGGTVNGTAPDNTSVGTGTFGGGTGGGGGNGNATPANAGGSPSGVFAGAGGGGGGGIASGNSVAAAGAGGSTGLFSGAAAGSTTPTAGASGFQIHNHQGYGGPGGGGGGSNSASTSNDRAGGNGGYYGAGGGGGGAGRNDTSNSGAGGDGAQGIAIIVTYF